jgi:hypothetical protein
MDGGGRGASTSTTGTDRPVLLSMRDGWMLKQGTRKGGASKGLPYTHVAMVGGMQLEVLENMSRDNADGLWNRFRYLPINPSWRKLGTQDWWLVLSACAPHVRVGLRCSRVVFFADVTSLLVQLRLCRRALCSRGPGC